MTDESTYLSVWPSPVGCPPATGALTGKRMRWRLRCGSRPHALHNLRPVRDMFAAVEVAARVEARSGPAPRRRYPRIDVRLGSCPRPAPPGILRCMCVRGGRWLRHCRGGLSLVPNAPLRSAATVRCGAPPAASSRAPARCAPPRGHTSHAGGVGGQALCAAPGHRTAGPATLPGSAVLGGRADSPRSVSSTSSGGGPAEGSRPRLKASRGHVVLRRDSPVLRPLWAQYQGPKRYPCEDTGRRPAQVETPGYVPAPGLPPQLRSGSDWRRFVGRDRGAGMGGGRLRRAGAGEKECGSRRRPIRRPISLQGRRRTPTC